MAESTAATPAAKPKRTSKPRKPASHPKYSEMIRQAIESEKARGGSSRQSIQKFIKKNFSVGDHSDLQIKLALRRMEAGGTVCHTRGLGASGSFKLVRGDQDAAAAAKRAAKPRAARAKRSPVKAAKPKSPAKPKKAPKSPAKPKKSAKSPAKKTKKSPKKAAAAPAAKTRRAAVKKAKPARAAKPKPAKKTAKPAKKATKKATKKK